MRTRLSRGTIGLFLLLCGVLLAPVWLVKYPPLLDYPNHLARAFVLAHLADTQFHFPSYYGADWGLYPYLAMDVIVVVLGRFLPIYVAGRIFLSLCLLGLPLAVWFFLREAVPGREHRAAGALLLAYDFFFLLGFLNSYFGVAACFLALGLWLRYLARPAAGRWCLALAGVTAAYFSHLMGFAVAGLVVTSYSLFTRRKFRELFFSGLLFLPGAVFYLRSQLLSGAGHGVEFRSLWDKVSALHALMHGYSTTLDILTVALPGVCLLVIGWRKRGWEWNWPWLGVAAILFAFYWALPAAYGSGSDVDVRVLPFLFIVGLAAVKTGRGARLLVPLVLLFFVLRTGSVAHHFVSAQPGLATLARSFSVTPAHALILPVVEVDNDDLLRRPFAHFWAYGVMERGWRSPYLFAIPGQTPLRILQDSYTLDGFWDLSYEEAPEWDRVRQDYDYVWAYNVPRFEPGLAAVGELVYEAGELQVYRMKKP